MCVNWLGQIGMNQDQEPPRKRGRPAKPREDRKEANFTFRVSPGLRSRLQSAAEAAHRSISSEIEHALLDYYRQEEELGVVARLVGAAIWATEQRIGRRCFADEEAVRLCRIAAHVALIVALGKPPRVETELVSIKARLAEMRASGFSESQAATIEEDLDRLDVELAVVLDTLNMLAPQGSTAPNRLELEHLVSDYLGEPQARSNRKSKG
jgi:predicted transcriptional regulator